MAMCSDEVFYFFLCTYSLHLQFCLLNKVDCLFFFFNSSCKEPADSVFYFCGPWSSGLGYGHSLTVFCLFQCLKCFVFVKGAQILYNAEPEKFGFLGCFTRTGAAGKSYILILKYIYFFFSSVGLQGGPIALSSVGFVLPCVTSSVVMASFIVPCLVHVVWSCLILCFRRGFSFFCLSETADWCSL